MTTEYSSDRELREIINECDEMSKDIILGICQRAIRTFNKLERERMGSIFVDDYPANFTFFDKLSIELQTKTYDEINPLLKEFIYETLEDEYNSLSRKDRFIVDHSDYFDPYSNEVIDKIHREVNKLYNDHLSLKKIENYLDRI